MPRPRADFSCAACEEGYTLPVESDGAPCLTPECAGTLKRLWNQAPGVIGAQTKIIDQVVQPEYNRQAEARPRVDPRNAPKPIAAGAALGILDANAKLAANIGGMGTLQGLKNLGGGPRPVRGG